MKTLWQDIQYKMLKSDSRINLLIGINVVMFLVGIIPALASFNKQYLLLSADVPSLARHAWTPLTYMFTHQGFLSGIFNILWLYWVGSIFEEYLSYKRLLGVYLGGGLVAAVFFIAAYNLLGLANINLPDVAITGASMSIMAVIVATATLLPTYEVQLIIFGRVQLKWIAIVYVALALLSSMSNGSAEMAHVGAAMFGFFYIKQLQRGTDWVAAATRPFKPKPKLRVVSSGYQPVQKKSANAPQQDEIDRILDKISASGLDSLSRQEKETLAQASKHNEG